VEDAAPISERKPRRWPKRLLKAFLWTGGALVMLWVRTFAFATWELNQVIAALKARGEPTSFAEAMEKIRAKDGETTGAELLRQAIRENERLRTPGDRFNLVGGSLDQPLTETLKDLLAQTFNESRPVLKLIEHAVELPPGPIVDEESSLAPPSKRLNAQPARRSLLRMLSLPLMTAQLNDDHHEVVKWLVVSFKLSESLAAEQGLMPQLVRVAMHGVSTANLRRLLPTLTLDEPDFRTLDAILGDLDRHARFGPLLSDERAVMGELFLKPDWLKEELRSAADPPPAFPPTWKDNALLHIQFRWIDVVCSPVGLQVRQRAAARAYSMPQEILDAIDVPTPWPDKLRTDFEEWRNALTMHRLLAMPPDHDALRMMGTAASRTRKRWVLARLALRLKWHVQRHGQLPDRLEELCDASMPELPTTWFEGKPFAYRKFDRTCRIESETTAWDLSYAHTITNDRLRATYGLLLEMDFTPPKKAAP
jgi:hypothetical protein